MTRAKAWATLFLEWRGPREAGFTEQRNPPPLGSGRITGWCFSGLPWHKRFWSNIGESVKKETGFDLGEANVKASEFGRSVKEVVKKGEDEFARFSTELLVFRTVGYSGADIRNLVNETAIMSVEPVRKGHSKVHQQDIIDVLDKQLLEGMGVLLTEEEQRKVQGTVCA
ncbi:hypothetical protein SLEP1_g38368 [Rubroshorea leprosula]|nr:hypothetical protein SLEP1_g38368 [Rubroshorea leprosula]